MKILLAVHQFPPEHMAGTEVLAYETARELTRRGYDLEVWAGFPADPQTAQEKPVDSYEYNGLTVHRYNHSYDIPYGSMNGWEVEYNNPLFPPHFKKYIKRSRPGIVHFFHLSRFSASTVEVCLNERLPVIFTPTDFWIICPTCQLRLPGNELCEGPDADSVNCVRHIVSLSPSKKTELFEKIPDWVLPLCANMAGKAWWPEKKHSPIIRAIAKRKEFILSRINRIDRLLVPTRFMEKLFMHNGVDGALMRHMPYGLNMEHFKNIPEKKRGRALRVGFIGSLSEHKGAHVLLEAVKLLPALPLEVKIYGNPEEYPSYAAELKKTAAGDKRVTFPGTFPNEKIGEVFSELDCLVVPSIWYENTPLVIYSAFASKTPVVATNLGGMSEVVHDGENGLLFEKGDAPGLAALLKRLVEDKGLIKRLAAKVVPPASISDYVDGLEAQYKEVLTERRAAI